MVDEDGNTQSWSSDGPNDEAIVTSSATDTPLGAIDANGVQTITKSNAGDTLTYTSRSGIAAVENTVTTVAGGGTMDLKTGELTGVGVTASAVAAVTYAGTKVTIETRAPGGNWTDITDAATAAAQTTTATHEVRITAELANGSIVRDTFSNNDNQFTITPTVAGTANSYTIRTTADSGTAIQINSEFAASKTFEQTTKTGVKVVNDAVSFLEDNSKTYLPAKAGFTHDAKTGEIKKAQSVESSASSSYGSMKTPVQDIIIEAYNETTHTWDKLSLSDTTGATLDIPDTVKKFRITAEYGDYNKVRDTFSNNTGGKFTVTKTQYGMDLGMTDTDAGTPGIQAQNSTTQLNVKSEDLVVVNVHFGTGSQKVDSYDTYINMASAKSLGVGEEAGDHIKTQKMAKKALDNLNIAITRKDEIRAEIGSTQNRLAATVENVSIQKENLQASESRISDVDVATEMTQFNKVQIMTNAAVSMLAQANSLPKAAQKLIDGR
ncbi:flagellin [Halodesulfovibrio spirochaetisodalis]|uniref:flagellin n=1 Tax=Halodesulfovibrio spirochaetisodalis TaxID=1560234 RepID=UPI002F91700F